MIYWCAASFGLCRGSSRCARCNCGWGGLQCAGKGNGGVLRFNELSLEDLEELFELRALLDG